MRRDDEPARLGRWLLRLRAGPERRAEIEDDLVELFRGRVRTRGRRYAQWRWLLDTASVRRPAWYPPSKRRGDHTMRMIWQDLRSAWRAFAAKPRFAMLAVAILALGIGVPTAVFSVVNAVLLRPLPYLEPDRLVAVTGLYKSATRRSPITTIAVSDMAKWRPHASSFDSMGAFAYTQLPVRVGDRAFAAVTALTDPEFLPTLGRPLAFGSFFSADAAPGGDSSAIVSYALWRDAFGGAPDAVGRSFTIDGNPYVLRGVFAADFQFPRSDASYYAKPIALVLPASMLPGFPMSSPQWFGIARLKRGVSVTSAEAELQGIAEGGTPVDVMSVQLTPLADETTRKTHEPLMALLGISLVLLVIASTNLMNLYFARGVARLREMSIRRALGGTTWQLTRLLLTESTLLASAGGFVGIWLARSAIRMMVALSPVHVPVTRAIDIDGTVVLFTIVLCLGTAVVAGLLPALHVSATTSEAVRHSGMRTSSSRGVQRVQQILCTAQIALGVALLTGVGLLANSLYRLYAVDPGYDVRRVFGFDLSVPNDVPLDQRAQFYGSALEEIQTIPGVERAGLISFLPPELRAGVFMGIAIDGLPPPERGAPARRANTLITSAGYFQTMRIPVVGGRDFTESDDRAHPPVMMVNEAFVRRYLIGIEPLGRKAGTGFDSLKPVREIVGVVKDTHDRGVAVQSIPTVYLSFRQFALPYGAIAVRTAGDAGSVIPAIRERLHRLNPTVPLEDFQMLDDRLSESLREPRFYTLMGAVCAAMAVAFVTFGLYGLVSYSVGRRTAEIGIRMAVGAQRARIVGLVLGQGLRMATIGVFLGLWLALLSTRALTSLLFEVRPADPPTFAAAAVIAIAVALAATYAPARRASRLDPVVALRQE